MMFLNHSPPSGILYSVCRLQNRIFMAPLTLIATSEMNDATLHSGKVHLFPFTDSYHDASTLQRIISASLAHQI